jgi:hypothetical protein
MGGGGGKAPPFSVGMELIVPPYSLCMVEVRDVMELILM